jgi:hypothetical protein
MLILVSLVMEIVLLLGSQLLNYLMRCIYLKGISRMEVAQSVGKRRNNSDGGALKIYCKWAWRSVGVKLTWPTWSYLV